MSHRNPRWPEEGPEWIGGHYPAFEPTAEMRRQVMAMAGFGIIQDEIARWLDIDDKTLRKYFRRELDIGATEANTRVAHALYTNATKHNSTAAQIWWTRARMGWKSTEVIEGNADRPLAVSFEWAPAKQPNAAAADGTPVVEATGAAMEIVWEMVEEDDANGGTDQQSP